MLVFAGCVQVVTFPAISIVEAVAAVTVLRMLPIPEMVYPPPAETVAQLLIAATLPANLLALNYVGPLASKARQSLELTEEDVERMLVSGAQDSPSPCPRAQPRLRRASNALLLSRVAGAASVQGRLQALGPQEGQRTRREPSEG